VTPVETVGLLHPGQMGAAVGGQIMTNGHTVLWCPDGRSLATQRRAEDAGLRPVPLGQLLADSEVVISICPSAAAEEIATAVADIGYRGIYVEANAISPGCLHRIFARLTDVGATVVDGCFFGSPLSGQSPTRLYLAGASAASRRVAELVADSLVEWVILGEQPGQASVLKMAFACFQRTSRVAAALAHALADDHGITDTLLIEAQRMPRDILANRDYLPSVAARAWRWAPEMHEIATTLDVQHLPSNLALATGDILQHWADTTVDQPTDPDSAIQRLHLPPQ
jgi:3-hydroxyisobutyrate dehydrogenase-like beta-hydroxyacid dehydrogenase